MRDCLKTPMDQRISCFSADALGHWVNYVDELLEDMDLMETREKGPWWKLKWLFEAVNVDKLDPLWETKAIRMKRMLADGTRN
jgi:hypothetical protein